MQRIISAFWNSVAGLRWAGRHEAAVRQELLGLLFAVPAAIWLADDIWLFVALVGSVLLLLAVELLNTGLEKLCDHVTPEQHPQIGLVKDLGSAAVLAALLLAALVWGAALWQAFNAT